MDRRARLQVTFALSALTFVGGYPIARVAEHLVYGDPNPVAIVASSNIALYWRSGVVACVAASLAPVFYELTAHPRRIITNLTVWIVVAATLIAAQSALVP